MRYTIALAVAASLAAPTWAATLVESNTPMGQGQKVWLDNNHARIESGQGDSYMLMNLSDKKMYAVNPSQKQIVELSGGKDSPHGMMPPGMAPPPAQEPPKVESKLEKVGDGPEIAGFATTHYKLSANGELCTEEFLSLDAFKVADVKTFTLAMQEMGPKKGGAMPFAQMNPCMAAGLEVRDQYEQLGVSMRTLNKDGKVVHEITSIKTDVEVAGGTFDLPTDYATSTPQEMMQKMMQEMSERMKNMTPEQRQQLMQHIPGGDKAPPPPQH